MVISIIIILVVIVVTLRAGAVRVQRKRGAIRLPVHVGSHGLLWLMLLLLPHHECPRTGRVGLRFGEWQLLPVTSTF